nr:hypothetical protein [Vibrio aestuarianus]
MKKLTDLFCHVDDFCKAFLPQWQKLQLESGVMVPLVATNT